MSSAEIVSWQIGVDRALRGTRIASFLSAPRWMQDRVMSDDQVEARFRLGHDTWAKWVRQGYEETLAAKGRKV